ncbi:MAG: hypothetical protein WD359_00770 [Dehalococcoidia bacterium]
MTSISLRVPLTSEQIHAATRIHDRLVSWKATDAALDELARSMPGFSLGECLVKASAINQLYGTNVYALGRMAEHIEQVLSEEQSVDLVERLATLNTNGKPRRHLSFASKFAHFYIDKDRFPIFGGYAIERLRFHLSSVNLPTDNPPLFADYVAAHSALIALCRLGCTGRELDRYLWLGGLYRAWSRNPNAPINVEVRTLFLKSDEDGTLRHDLNELQPTA